MPSFLMTHRSSALNISSDMHKNQKSDEINKKISVNKIDNLNKENEKGIKTFTKRHKGNLLKDNTNKKRK